MDIPVALLLVTVLYQVVDFLRELTNLPAQKSAVLTQLVAWVAGVVVVILGAHASLFETFNVNGHPLTSLDTGSLIFLGLGIASFGSTIADTIHAVDRSDSHSPPPLLHP